MTKILEFFVYTYIYIYIEPRLCEELTNARRRLRIITTNVNYIYIWKNLHPHPGHQQKHLIDCTIKECKSNPTLAYPAKCITRRDLSKVSPIFKRWIKHMKKIISYERIVGVVSDRLNDVNVNVRVCVNRRAKLTQ